MKQRIINKVYFLSVIKEGKVIEILRGKCLDDLLFEFRTRYQGCEKQVMEYNDEYNIYVPDIEEHLMMIRRRHLHGISK